MAWASPCWQAAKSGAHHSCGAQTQLGSSAASPSPEQCHRWALEWLEGQVDLRACAVAGTIAAKTKFKGFLACRTCWALGKKRDPGSTLGAPAIPSFLPKYARSTHSVKLCRGIWDVSKENRYSCCPPGVVWPWERAVQGDRRVTRMHESFV